MSYSKNDNAAVASSQPATGDLRLKTRIAEMWNGRSKVYDQDFGHGFCDDVHQGLWHDALERNVKPSDGLRVLDVGCGTGFLALQLAKMGCAVTGVDLASNMLEKARAKAETDGLKVDFQEGDAENPPFNAETFDLIVCRHVVWTLPDPAGAFRNWWRLLVPGGRVMPVEGSWNPRTFGERARTRIANVLERIKPTPGRDANWQATYPGNAANLPFFGGVTSENLSASLIKAGFSIEALDGLEDIIAHERSRAPIGRKLLYGPGRRYIVVARKSDNEENK